MHKPLVIYHDNCLDGTCSAWLLWKSYNGVQLHAAKYGDPPPLVTGRNVIVADFSYPAEVMKLMHAQANSMVVLDHHKTAEEACRGLTFCKFDMAECGASLVLDWLDDQGIYSPGITTTVVKYVKDYDLWQFKHEQTRPFNERMKSYGFAVDLFDKAFQDYCSNPYGFIKEGRAILDFRESVIAYHVEHAHDIMLCGHSVPFVQCSYPGFINDVGEALGRGRKFAVVALPGTDDSFKYSLRSAPSGIDVSEIAKHFGGGGHNHAAGFVSKHPIGVE